VLATAELYGSKLVAALDRQHPRDLFDVHCLLQSGGLTDETIECFVAYLAGHNRPVHEMLFSRDQDPAIAFENEFQGMARHSVELPALIEARQQLRRELHSRLTNDHRRFLLGLLAAIRHGRPCGALTCPNCPQSDGSSGIWRSSSGPLRKSSIAKPGNSPSDSGSDASTTRCVRVC
jgi:hypothetical protein